MDILILILYLNKTSLIVWVIEERDFYAHCSRERKKTKRER